jgi:selenide, water dikinase
VQKGIAPGGTHANWRFLNGWVDYDSDIEKPEQLLLCDAQTSGGLLICLESSRATDLVAALHQGGDLTAAVIGEINCIGAGRIQVSH